MNKDIAKLAESQSKEAKLLILSMAKLREFCQKWDRQCDKCPLQNHDKSDEPCILTSDYPCDWDVDGTLYKIGFNAGYVTGTSQDVF